jgi:threonine 3-dehydrogenase
LGESLTDAVRAFAGASGADGAPLPPGAGDPGGVDIALETAGVASALADCLEAVRLGGTVIMVGVAPESASLPFPIWRFHRRQLKLQGVYGSGGVGTFHDAVAVMPQLELTRMISHRFGLGEIDEAYALARSGQRGKLLIEPWR